MTTLNSDNRKTVLVTAFDGEDNSSKIICQKLKADCKKIILPNDKNASCEMLKKELDSGFRYVFSLGQKPLIKNKISVEDTAKLNGKILKTNAESISEIIKKSDMTAIFPTIRGLPFATIFIISG